jgi:hypothetical protein
MQRDTPMLSAYDHFATMVFAQLTYRESLRDIEACLGSRRRLLYHSGIRGTIKRCNLAYANEHRDARMFAEVAAVLMRHEVVPKSWTGRIVNPNSEERSQCPRNDASIVQS